MDKLVMNLNSCDISHYVVLLILGSFVRALVATPIVGGTVVETVGDKPKYPFMVSLQDCAESQIYKHFCGGSLISHSWILTAAHCVYTKNASQIVAVIGQEDISEPQRLTYHKVKAAEYLKFNPSDLQNDIALLSLRKPYVPPYESSISNIFHDYQSYAKLPDYSMKANSTNPCQIIGYGATSNGGITQSNLRIGEVTVISNRDCENIIGHIWAPQTGDNTVCALGEKQDTCQGDSGGPLICPYKGQNYVYGIVSHGIACGIAGVPGLYTLTMPYFNRISCIIKKSPYCV